MYDTTAELARTFHDGTCNVETCEGYTAPTIHHDILAHREQDARYDVAFNAYNATERN